ncbi:MAG: MBL fold metallo-hydrolase [Burkholderiales bacterium]
MRVLILFVALTLFSLPSWAVRCGATGVALQVLGSGGPELQDKRASSSYLVWRDGKARVLVDAGGGSALRFGESGAQMADLDAVLFTHFHVDHSGDFPALIKSSWFEKRIRPLPVYGPYGIDFMPSTTEFVAALFGDPHGVFRYLSDLLGPPTGEKPYKLQPHTIEIEDDNVQTVVSEKDMQIKAVSVTHGPFPALAWRVELSGKSIAFSGDTNGRDGTLEVLAKNADILVAHNAVPEGITGVARNLHMPPTVIGEIAEHAGVKKVVLSHRMLRTLGREKETLALIRKSYRGPVRFADDLDCFPLR